MEELLLLERVGVTAVSAAGEDCFIVAEALGFRCAVVVSVAGVVVAVAEAAATVAGADADARTFLTNSLWM